MVTLVEGNNELNIAMELASQACFVYATALNVEPYGGPNDIRWDVGVANVGVGPGTCHLKVYDRLKVRIGGWQKFVLKSDQEAVIQPGETHTFSGAHGRSGYTYQLMAKCEAGVILNPTSPLEFLCPYCDDSFATEEERDAHIQTAHQLYLPMDPVTAFSIMGIAWPTSIDEGGGITSTPTSWACEVKGDTVLTSPDLPLDQPAVFNVPEDWAVNYNDGTGRIPNTILYITIRYHGVTNKGGGVTGWLCDSPLIYRVPNNGIITFRGYDRGCRDWTIVEQEGSQ